MLMFKIIKRRLKRRLKNLMRWTKRKINSTSWAQRKNKKRKMIKGRRIKKRGRSIIKIIKKMNYSLAIYVKSPLKLEIHCSHISKRLVMPELCDLCNFFHIR